METFSALTFCDDNPPVTERPLHRGNTADPLFLIDFSLILAESMCWIDSQGVGDMKRLNAHVMSL